jgi:hypothetical protein
VHPEAVNLGVVGLEVESREALEALVRCPEDVHAPEAYSEDGFRKPNREGKFQA